MGPDGDCEPEQDTTRRLGMSNMVINTLKHLVLFMGGHALSTRSLNAYEHDETERLGVPFKNTRHVISLSALRTNAFYPQGIRRSRFFECFVSF